MDTNPGKRRRRSPKLTKRKSNDARGKAAAKAMLKTENA
jgi:hypothetical protein